MTAKERYDLLYGRFLRSSSDNPPATLGYGGELISENVLLEQWIDRVVASRLPQRRAIYIHVPFCSKHRCTFCMYKSSTKYSKALLKWYTEQVQHMAERFSVFSANPITNFYVGGGTPTIFSPKDLKTLLLPFSGLPYELKGERTCEMSPTTATVEHVDVVKELGLNRISIGVQSFDTRVLESVNRKYASPHVVSKLVKRARQQGLMDVNIDLMFGLPKTTVKSVEVSATLAAEIGALSISIYNYRHFRRELDLNNQTRQRMIEQFRAVREVLESKGWECYAGDETTEYHLFYSPERNRDTIRYQTSPNGVENYEVIGLGAYANGFHPAMAYTCVSDGQSFASGKALFRCWKSNIDQQIRLGVINILYVKGGMVDKIYFRKTYGLEFSEYFKEEISDLMLLGKAVDCETTFKLLPTNQIEKIILQRFFLPRSMLL